MRIAPLADVRYNQLGKRTRLEQEKVGFDWVNTALDRLHLVARA